MTCKELLNKCVRELEKLNGLVVKSEGVDCQFDDLIAEVQEAILAPPKTIDEWFDEWNNNIIELSEKEVELLNLKEQFNEQEFEIVFVNDDVDFKALYGSTSEKVRKQHAAKELQAVSDAIHDLEISISYLKRRMDYIKHLMKMQSDLMNYEVGFAAGGSDD